MKLILLISLLVLITTTGKAQLSGDLNTETGIAMGLSGGYTSKQCMAGALTLGAMLPAHNHASINIIILSELKNPNNPSVFEARFGHFFKTIELYGGAGYHIAGTDNKISLNPDTGIKPAYGIIKHFYNSPWTLGAGMSGKICSLQIGLFGVR